MLAHELRQELDSRGWSQREAARQLGVAESDISRWLGGVRRVPHWLPLALKGISKKSRKLTAGAVVLFILLAPLTRADDRPGISAGGFATAFAIHGGAQAADHFSTQAALRRGGVEVGPIARHTGPNTARLLGSAAFIGADILAQKKGRKWLVWTVRIASVGVAGYAYSRNSKVNRGGGR
jgi:hypothetical protein